MKKLFFLLILIGFSVAIGYSIRPEQSSSNQEILTSSLPKREILRFAIVTDSSGENQLLEKALSQAKGAGVNFVIGLGDWTTVGTRADLLSAKKVFDESGFKYYVTAGDHDLWDSRDKKEEPLNNFIEVFGEPNSLIEQNGIKIVLIDNSDIYKGLGEKTWDFLDKAFWEKAKLTFVAAHKTPFHPESKHIMGAQSVDVANQAQRLMKILRENSIDGFFSGDIHFFARFNTEDEKIKITTIGAVARERNFQGPRFGIVKVFSDYTWEVEDVEIR